MQPLKPEANESAGQSQNEQQTLNQLATAVLPEGLNNLLSGIDDLLEAAQQTINGSLAQSSALIEQSRQNLLRLNQQTQQQESNADEPQLAGQTDSEADNSAQATATLEQQQHYQALTEQQAAVQKAAQEAEAAMTSAMQNIENNMQAQHQAYESAVMQHHQQAVQAQS